jgi:beta-N-acetylhexosaminidase
MAVIPGIELLWRDHREWVEGQRVGLVSNASSVTRQLVSTMHILQQMPGVSLAALFAPEHGWATAVAAGSAITDTSYADLPIYSLYGRTQRPTPEMLADLDCLVFDLQTVGVRFYTYLTTLFYLLQSAAEHHLPLIVCDRPNPIGGEIVEGPVLANEFASFVGCGPLPIRHGLTVGEAARLFNDVWQVKCELHVIPCEGWRRSLWFDETHLLWAPPSPNMPKLETAVLYPGACLTEGTNLSEGRGTTLPFEIVGAPWLAGSQLAGQLNSLNLPGVKFRPVQFTPTASKWQGQCCNGVQLHVTDRQALRPVTVILHLLAAVRQLHPTDFAWNLPHFDHLVGTDKVREAIEKETAVTDIVAGWAADLAQYQSLSKAVHIYPN